MDSNELIILFHPLNTLFTFNFNYLSRSNHVLTFNKLKSEVKDTSELLKEITLLPYIQKEILDKYTQSSLIKHFMYLIESKEEIEVIKEEHSLLNLDKYYPFRYILKDQLITLTTSRVIMISEEGTDFLPINTLSNYYKIINWMIYKETDDYLNYQKINIPLLLYKDNNYDLIIESFRQATPLIKYITTPTTSAITVKDQCELFFKDAINVVYFFDCSSKSKSYRKRELAQSTQKIKYFPFITKHYGLDSELSSYPPLHVFLQRCPYFYLRNKDRCIEIQNIIDQHKEIAQLHNMNVIEMVYNRYALYDCLINFIDQCKDEIKAMNIKVTIPLTIKYSVNKAQSKEHNYTTISSLISNTKMSFPYVIKPDSGTIHEMKLILNEDGLKSLFTEKEYAFIDGAGVIIVQEFIPHGGSMIKNYHINGKSYTFVRPSLPDMQGEILNSEKLAQGTFSFMNEMIYQGQVDNMFNKNYEDSKLLSQVNGEIIDKITSLFIIKTGITLFGLDFLYNQKEDTYSLLEINYFPSYRELGNDLPNQFTEHIMAYYSKHKK